MNRNSIDQPEFFNQFDEIDNNNIQKGNLLMKNDNKDLELMNLISQGSSETTRINKYSEKRLMTERTYNSKAS